MIIDDTTLRGRAILKYINLFSNRWNESCDACWFIFGQFVAAILSLGIGFVLGKVL